MSNLQSALPGPGAAVEAAARFSAKPATATSPLVSWLGLAGFIVGMVLIYWLPLTRVEVILVILACTGLPMLIVDIVFLKAASPAFDRAGLGPADGYQPAAFGDQGPGPGGNAGGSRTRLLAVSRISQLRNTPSSSISSR